jgi:hypothetical protein
MDTFLAVFLVVLLVPVVIIGACLLFGGGHD